MNKIIAVFHWKNCVDAMHYSPDRLSENFESCTRKATFCRVERVRGRERERIESADEGGDSPQDVYPPSFQIALEFACEMCLHES